MLYEKDKIEIKRDDINIDYRLDLDIDIDSAVEVTCYMRGVFADMIRH